ncbi:MAG TPA: hypothetical protein VGZ26_01345 [Pirellulales bacterium]|jgi:hypothetical protein|nr:hypothetical protein [Pirellulales bacterium]
MSEAQQPRRHLLQFNLGTLLAWLTVIGLGLGAVKAVGLSVVLGFSGLFLSCLFVPVIVLCLWPLASILSRWHDSVGVVIAPLVYGAVGITFFMFGEAIDQPHPSYVSGNWFTVGMNNGLPMIPLFAIGGLICAGPDAMSPLKTAVPFPDFGVLLGAAAQSKGRLMLILGFAPILAYYSLTVAEVLVSNEIPSGLQWPPKRVFVSCLFLWGLLWLVERSFRSTKGAVLGPIVFLVLSLIQLPIGFGVLRE